MSKPHNCDCFRLASELPDPMLYPEEGRLPNHVCLETLEASSQNWIDYHWGYNSAKPAPWPVYRRIADGRWVECDPTNGWPIRILNKPTGVVLIIRQWAEAQAPGLSKLLERTPAWSDVLTMLREHTDQDGQSHLTSSQLQNLLSENGLPATPSTARFALVRAGAQSVTQAEPTRGVLVTTFIIVPTVNGDSSADQTWPAGVHGEAIHEAAFSSHWPPRDLGRLVQKVAKSHADFWRRCNFHDMMLNTKLTQFNTGAPIDPLLKKALQAVSAGTSPKVAAKRMARAQERQMGRPISYEQIQRNEWAINKALSRDRKRREHPDQ